MNMGLEYQLANLKSPQVLDDVLILFNMHDVGLTWGILQPAAAEVGSVSASNRTKNRWEPTEIWTKSSNGGKKRPKDPRRSPGNWDRDKKSFYLNYSGAAWVCRGVCRPMYCTSCFLRCNSHGSPRCTSISRRRPLKYSNLWMVTT